MAKKNDNTILWLAALGVGGYLWYKHNQAAPVANSTVPNASAGTLLLPPSTAINSNAPALNAPSNAPSNVALNTTNLVPAAVDHNDALIPGQALAINPGGTPIVNGNGQLMVFAPVPQMAPFVPLYDNPSFLAFEKRGMLTGFREHGDIL